ncbi:MAG: alpha/beta fold hydrolase [Sphingomonadaceae bacterium]
MEIESFDGTRLQVAEMGSGPPVLLLHGLFSSAEVNWIRYGTARRIAEAGYRLILPDLRGHGRSEAPDDPARWPMDVLALDAEHLVRALDLGPDLVVGGYSLGARTTARLLARGLRPRAAILAGMGLEGLTDGTRRAAWFIRMIEGRGGWEKGSGEYVAERFMTANVALPDCMIHLLKAQADTPADELAALDLPVLVVAGAEDRDNGSATNLARLLPRGRYAEIPGTHMGSVTRPELADAILAFLAEIGAAR